ncbi:MAG: hypothetical protein JW762_11670 [Dehalococcoidales bacterium]|nr:hypothetical protein [Dehalococcoidales bacterium]
MAELGSAILERIQNKAATQSRNLQLLWGALFALILADGLITEFAVTNDVGYEANPLLANMLGSHKFFLFKLLGAILVILFLRNISKKHYRVGLISSYIAVILYMIVVFWNLLAYQLVMY